MYRLLFAFAFVALVLAVGPALACDPNVPVGFAYTTQVGFPVNTYTYAQTQVAFGAVAAPTYAYGAPRANFHGEFHAQPPVVVAAPPAANVKIKIVNRHF